MASPNEAVLSNRERSARGIELLVFLVLILPPTILQWFAPPLQDSSFVLLATSSILANVALLVLVCYLNWRSGESLRYLGLQVDGLGREAVVGVLLFLPFAAIAAGLHHMLEAAGLPSKEAPLPPITSSLQMLLAGFGLATIAVVEETVFRGYLLTRIIEWRRGRKAFAVIASSAIFALGHEYQGMAGIISVGGMGIMFAGVYLWRGSLVAPIVLHYLQNALAVVAIGSSG